jgi:hypothetical protein
MNVKYFDFGDGPEPCTTLAGIKLLANAMIDSGECKDPERAMRVLQTAKAQLNNKQTIVWCAHCAHKIGIKQCSGCPKTSKERYCSRECQVAAWPSHKKRCGCRKKE